MLRPCRKISMKFTMSYPLLRRGGKRSCTASSTQVTHGPTSSLPMKREAQRKCPSLRCRPDIAREKIKFPNPHGNITFTQENKSKAEYKQEKEWGFLNFFLWTMQCYYEHSASPCIQETRTFVQDSSLLSGAQLQLQVSGTTHHGSLHAPRTRLASSKTKALI